jgi:phosphatidate cytidylyltransferase
MLKYRLLSGTLMALVFVGVVILDGWLDGSLTGSVADHKRVRGTGVCILIILLVIATQFELSRLAAAKNLKIFRPVSIIGSILLASTWYWPQLVETSARAHLSLVYLSLVLAFVLMALLLSQYIRYGTENLLANCGANCFSVIYLGLLSGFALAITIDYGVWSLLMVIFVVKCSDIGAYAIGRPFGKHKFSPKISPGKTWEGMVAAIVTAMIVGLVFAVSFDIMVWWLAVIFGFCLAFAAQAGDLIESMIKRDAQQKDSAKNVPGFGGILDVIDSPLVAAPFGYLFFMLFA